MTQTFEKSIGRSVIDQSSADDIGEVKSFVVDRRGEKIRGVQIGGRKRKPCMVDWKHIVSFGDDAVMVTSSSDAHDAREERTTQMTKGAVEFVGARVLTTDGAEVAKVTDVHFDPESGEIEGAMTDRAGRIDSSRIRSVGAYAVVVDPD